MIACIGKIGQRIVYPQGEDSCMTEMALSIATFGRDSISIQQEGRSVTIPMGSLPELIKALRDCAREAE